VIAAIFGLLVFNRDNLILPVSSASDSAQRPLSVVVKSSGPLDASVAGIIVGNSTGRFKREALSVELQAGQNDLETLSFVASTANSIGLVNTYSFLLASAQSVPIVAFAAGYQRSPIVFYTLAKSNIRSPEDFIDRKVGYQPDQATAFVYDALLAKNRISGSRIRQVNVASDPSLLLNGSVDVLPGDINLAGTFRRMGVDQYSIDPAKFGVHAPGTVYFTNAETLRTNPELVRRFLRGLINGWTTAYEDYSISIPAVAKVIGEDLGFDDIRFQMEQQRELLRPLGARYGEFTRAQWSFAQNDLLQQRRLASPINIDAVINDDVLSTVNRELGSQRELGSRTPH
jgi:ABC-type nitrate/sulfonate/bicarbonate transport system substrate-binding protein